MMIMEKVVPAAYRCSVPGSARAPSRLKPILFCLVRILSTGHLKTVPPGKPRPNQPSSVQRK